MHPRWRFDRPTNGFNLMPSYASGTPEREKLLEALEARKHKTDTVPLIIDGEEVETENTFDVVCPHDHGRVLAKAHLAGEAELERAIEAALAAHEAWATMDGYQRAAVFHRATDLLEGPRRYDTVATIMLNQSKTPYEAEIDLIELIDFLRFNAYYMQTLYEDQPNQAPGEFNRLDWRPLEGFVLAVPPFNFFAIGGNLPTAPAIVGNVALWKPARSVTLANYLIMRALLDAGLPAGVINFVPFSSRDANAALDHPMLAGLHFTGSYETLVEIWQRVGQNLTRYKNFPRIVGETGGKDFIVAHPSADAEEVANNAVRGAFEYQGQKCSACSRLFVPESLWPRVKDGMLRRLQEIKVGPTEELDTFVGAIITEDAYRKIVAYLEHAKSQPDEYEFLFGGEYDDSKGWFVTPTVIVSQKPDNKLMCEEIFGPVLSVYVYPDAEFERTLEVCDASAPFALTGAIFAKDRAAVALAERKLRYAAGNFYINDKPTGSIVGRQPFGGARHSGTNDKAGSWVNLARWLSPRAIKETLVPPREWQRPYME